MWHPTAMQQESTNTRQTRIESPAKRIHTTITCAKKQVKTELHDCASILIEDHRSRPFSLLARAVTNWQIARLETHAARLLVAWVLFLFLLSRRLVLRRRFVSPSTRLMTRCAQTCEKNRGSHPVWDLPGTNN